MSHKNCEMSHKNFVVRFVTPIFVTEYKKKMIENGND